MPDIPLPMHQMWVNGARRSQSRVPEHGYYRVAGIPDATDSTQWNQDSGDFNGIHPVKPLPPLTQRNILLLGATTKSIRVDWIYLAVWH